MSRLASNYQHTQWDDVSMRAAARLPDETIRLIKELYSIAADERMQFTYDLNNLQSSIQQEAALRGQMEAYEKLLDMHEEAMRSLTTGTADDVNNADSILNPSSY